MAEHPEPARHAADTADDAAAPLTAAPASTGLARRSMLAGTGLAMAGVLAACTSDDDAPEATPEDEQPGQGEESGAPRIAAPEIIGTAEWGARRPAQYLQTLNERPSYLIIHHTTTPNVTDGSRTAALDMGVRLQNAHENQGWGDSGHHFTMTRGGYALEARHGSKYALEGGESFILGVHALGFNAYALGIECQGFYMLNPPPQSMYQGLVHLCAYICQQYHLPPARVIGHRDLVRTSCCGDAFYAKLPVLREDIRVSLETGQVRVTENFGADNLFDDSEITADYLR
ncbi:MAG: peptidoglycan recognition family protein [Micrococcus sp.]|nr:peptidoglycan recognition family protein [Micrococcus sp.]